MSEIKGEAQVRPRVVLIAGVPRSGSTWCFNAARLLLLRNGQAAHAAWCEEYDRNHPARWHLVKVHRPEHVADVTPWRTITSRRPLADCLASRIGMGWTREEVEKLVAAARNQRELYRAWRPRSDAEIDYADILAAPASMVRAIAAVLELNAAGADEIASTLAELEPPDAGSYDRGTLLHPGHRRPPGATAEIAARVRDALAAAGEPTDY